MQHSISVVESRLGFTLLDRNNDDEHNGFAVTSSAVDKRLSGRTAITVGWHIWYDAWTVTKKCRNDFEKKTRHELNGFENLTTSAAVLGRKRIASSLFTPSVARDPSTRTALLNCRIAGFTAAQITSTALSPDRSV